MKQSYTFEIVILKESEDAGYFALCPALPGCFSNGLTVEETKKNMSEAIELHLEGLHDDGEDIPQGREHLLLETLSVAV